MDQRWRLALFILAFCIAACGDESESNHDHHNHSESITDGMCNGESTLTSGDLNFDLSFDPVMVPMNALFTLTVTLTDARGQPVEGTLTFEATMPDHGHGMNVAPSIENGSDPGVFIIQGINLHMPGTWKLDFTLESAGATTVATVDYECSEG